jgi:hypothetical protein
MARESGGVSGSRLRMPRVSAMLTDGHGPGSRDGMAISPDSARHHASALGVAAVSRSASGRGPAHRARRRASASAARRGCGPLRARRQNGSGGWRERYQQRRARAGRQRADPSRSAPEPARRRRTLSRASRPGHLRQPRPIARRSRRRRRPDAAPLSPRTLEHPLLAAGADQELGLGRTGPVAPAAGRGATPRCPRRPRGRRRHVSRR